MGKRKGNQEERSPEKQTKQIQEPLQHRHQAGSQTDYRQLTLGMKFSITFSEGHDMDARTITKLMVLKRLVESIDESKREKNMGAMDRVAERITDDIGSILGLLVGSGEDSRAPHQKPIKGLSEN
jgi:hypothetical protein